jgi:hypothetical protein
MKDKNIFNSKKFAAFFASIAVLGGCLVLAIVQGAAFNTMTGVVMGIIALGLTTVTVSYLTNQATVDRFLGTVKGALSNDIEGHLEKRRETSQNRKETP